MTGGENVPGRGDNAPADREFLLEMFREVRENQKVLNFKVDQLGNDLHNRIDNKFSNVYDAIERVQINLQNGSNGMHARMTKIEIEQGQQKVRSGFIGGLAGLGGGLLDILVRVFYK